MVVAGYYENACGCHNHKGDGVAATEDEKCYGIKHRKAHGCHRHKADGEQNDYKNAKADESCAPINKPYTCQEGKDCLATLEIVPYGERVAEHTTKERESGGKLSLSIGILHNQFCKQYGENGFTNVDCHNGKGCGGKAVETLEIGETGVFTAKLANVLFINQTRKNDSTVDASKQIGKRGKCRTIQI